ncbi:hypothetical protein [uncultured Prevotella sp.]|nr:hypothetical protein [uncultured Prevotella sp.]MCS2664551.1 hypothetical protein [Phocaeicola vulgatus]
MRTRMSARVSPTTIGVQRWGRVPDVVPRVASHSKSTIWWKAEKSRVGQ